MRDNRGDAVAVGVMDDDTKAMIYDGASISQLAKIFGMDNRSVTARLGVDCQPVGKRNGRPVYSIAEAAKFLVEHDLNLDDMEKIAAFMQKVDTTRLPRALTKEYWQAMLNRQKYLEQAGDLWPTEKVVEVISEMFKLIQMPLRLGRDSVANEQELTPRQQQILLGILDGISNDLYQTIVGRFGDEIFEQEEVDDEDDSL